MGMEFIQHESCVLGGNVVTPKIQNGEGYTIWLHGYTIETQRYM